MFPSSSSENLLKIIFRDIISVVCIEILEEVLKIFIIIKETAIDSSRKKISVINTFQSWRFWKLLEDFINIFINCKVIEFGENFLEIGFTDIALVILVNQHKCFLQLTQVFLVDEVVKSHFHDFIAQL